MAVQGIFIHLFAANNKRCKMSPKAETMLLNEIIPIITATVPRVVKIQSGEDTEEVIQDTLAQAVDI